MGFYIETEGNQQDKASSIIKDFEGEEIKGPMKVHDIPATKVLVCVVKNMFFDAAAIGFSDEEIRVFAQPDGRLKRWFLVPRTLAIKACPPVEQFMTY